MVEEVGPELIIVVSAHRNIAEDTVIQSSAWGIQCPGVVFIVWSVRHGEIDAAIAYQELHVWIEIVKMVPRVDHPTTGCVHAQIWRTSCAVTVKIARLRFESESSQIRRALVEVPIDP